MSYDVYFGYQGPTYPHEEWRKYTSNVSGMWHEALGGNVTLGDLIDRAQTNADLIEPLRAAVADMASRPSKYRRMNPKNGWGDYEGALAFLRWMLEMAEAVPGGTCGVSR